MFSHTKSDDFCGSKTTRWLDKHRLNLWTDADSQIMPRSNSAVASLHSIELSLKSGIELEQNSWCKIWLT